MWYLITGAVVAVSVIVKVAMDDNKKEKEKERQKQIDKDRRQEFFKKNLIKINHAVEDFKRLITLKGGSYCNYSKLKSWELKYSDLRNLGILSTRFNDLDLRVDQKRDIEYYIHFSQSSESIRKKFNDDFYQNELLASKELLSKVDGNKSLDNQQRKAIIRDEDNSLVIAGAGCGKTTTIIGKVKYLTERLAVPPDQILLISFTKKSAEDLVRKVNVNGITASTFHKLGLNIIRNAENAPPLIYDQSSQYFIEQTFKSFISKDSDYLKKSVEYFTDYIRIEKDDFQTKNLADHIQHLKDQNFRPFKKKIIVENGRETILREIVKSQQECKIANFLLFNGVKYEYELRYEINTRTPDYRQYAPDFTIFQNGIRIYLEHYGIDKNGNVPPFFANETTTLEEARTNYHNGIKWKRKLHEQNDTICLETFSYQFRDNTIFDSLREQLVENGIELKELSNDEKWELINDTASDEIKGLTSLFNTFLSLYKSNNLTIDYLKSKVASLTGFDKQRTVRFLNLFNPILWAYQKMLAEREQIDFSDMINKATGYVNQGLYLSKYKYIIVDEFQDISYGRYDLIKALKSQVEDCKLFAVGDDWQSIFRFTGSDISLFNDFQSYFGFTEISKIETTYRFGQPLIDISGEFIMKNPSQIPKELKTKLKIETDLKIYFNEEIRNDDTIPLKEAIDDIILRAMENSNGSTISNSIVYDRIKDKSFYILGRYTFDIKRIDLGASSPFSIAGEERITYKYNEQLEIDLTFLTVHRSKGLQADYVFILNCNSGKVGFPSEIMDDPVLQLILGHSEIYPNSEERRLFYVALSRAKERAVCIVNSNFASKFIFELNNVSHTSEKRKCPRCKSGDLVLREGVSASGNAWAFEACSNFATYNCDFKEWIDLTD